MWGRDISSPILEIIYINSNILQHVYWEQYGKKRVRALNRPGKLYK
jgi:hypothetical protein